MRRQHFDSGVWTSRRPINSVSSRRRLYGSHKYVIQYSYVSVCHIMSWINNGHSSACRYELVKYARLQLRVSLNPLRQESNTLARTVGTVCINCFNNSRIIHYSRAILLYQLIARLTTCAGNWLRTITSNQTVYNNSSLFSFNSYDITG